MVIGSARDIIEEVGVPRFVFTDLPLGNPVGPPGDSDSQLAVLAAALTLAERAWRPRITVQPELVWPGGDQWRHTYMALDDLDELRRLGEERRARQAAEKVTPPNQSPS